MLGFCPGYGATGVGRGWGRPSVSRLRRTRVKRGAEEGGMHDERRWRGQREENAGEGGLFRVEASEGDQEVGGNHAAGERADGHAESGSRKAALKTAFSRLLSGLVSLTGFLIVFLWLIVRTVCKRLWSWVRLIALPVVKRIWFLWRQKRQKRGELVAPAAVQGEKLATAAEVQALYSEIAFLKRAITELHANAGKLAPETMSSERLLRGGTADGVGELRVHFPFPQRMIVARHAKSNLESKDGDDYSRPLNEAGRRSAEFLGSELERLGWHPSQVLCSNAKRARDTFSVMPLSGNAPLKVVYTDELYYALDAEEMIATLERHMVPSAQVLLVVCHYPGCSELLHWMTGGERVKMAPGCAALLERQSSSLEDSAISAASSSVPLSADVAFADSGGSWELAQLIKPH